MRFGILKPTFAATLAFLATACDWNRTRAIAPTGPTSSDGVVVESTILNGTTVANGLGCEVSGRIRNDSERDQAVRLRFTAFDDGDELDRLEVEIDARSL